MEPIKTISENGLSDINRELYRTRIKEDPRMDNKASLIAKGKVILSEMNTKEIVQPLADNDNLDLNRNFWNFRLGNGLQSMRRGFYRILDEPDYRDINGIQTLSAHVLYSYGDDDSDCNLYFANVGTLVNKNAVAGNLSTNKLVPLNPPDKKEFIRTYINKTIYVSRSEPVTDSRYGQMKEVLWFTWD